MELHAIALNCIMHGIVWAKDDQCMEFHINNLIQSFEATPGIYSELQLSITSGSCKSESICYS